MNLSSNHPRHGLTLVEVLLLVAAVAIIAAIATPNFIAARIRSDVAQVKNDQRNLATAIEAYYVDHQNFPPNNFGMPRGVPGIGPGAIQALILLSTPIAYIPNSFIEDPFARKYDPSDVTPGFIAYTNSLEADADAIAAINGANLTSTQKRTLFDTGFWLTSAGPDHIASLQNIADSNHDRATGIQIEDFHEFVQELAHEAPHYDPSNGTISNGDIFRTRSGPGFWPSTTGNPAL